MEQDKENILKLKQGEMYLIPESDYGKAEVYLINDRYFLFGIPMYGGEPWYNDNYKKEQIDELLKVVYSWT